MKNLLIIAYYFPPSGGPGVQRVLKHVKYLPEFGWQPIVFTVSNGQFPARDESLIKQIPKSTIVEKFEIFEPYDYYRKLTGKKPGDAIDVNVIKKEGQKTSFKEKIAEFIRATFFIPDARAMWLLNAGKQLDKVFNKYKIDAIYSSSPPYTCSMIAKKAKKKSRLPWVAGFRDPWTEFISSPNRWFLPAMIDRRFEFSVFNQADAVECAWVGIIKDAIKKYPKLDSSKFFHVPNGFDSSDFPVVEQSKNDKFTLTYTGSMYGRRNPESLFKAIELLLSQKLLESNNLHLRFVGRFGAEVQEMFDKATFKDSIEIVNYVPHSKSIEYLLKSDALLLVVDESKESEEIVPGKVYEYIGVKVPIIAIGPNHSAIADLLAETGSGKIAHQTEVEKIADIFMEYYNFWNSSSDTSFTPNYDIINKYERKNATRELSNLLNSMICR